MNPPNPSPADELYTLIQQYLPPDTRNYPKELEALCQTGFLMPDGTRGKCLGRTEKPERGTDEWVCGYYLAKEGEYIRDPWIAYLLAPVEKVTMVHRWECKEELDAMAWLLWMIRHYTDYCRFHPQDPQRGAPTTP